MHNSISLDTDNKAKKLENIFPLYYLLCTAHFRFHPFVSSADKYRILLGPQIFARALWALNCPRPNCSRPSGARQSDGSLYYRPFQMLTPELMKKHL